MTQIFRITHYLNLPFILRHGLHCSNADLRDPDFVQIGFPTLIQYRQETIVPLPPGGTLADYIAFYFWYQSPMLYVIFRANDPEVIITPQHEIIYLVSSIEKLVESNRPFVFTDRHAKLDYANFYNDPADIDSLPWDSIKSSQWGRQYGAERQEIKQAECLVYQFMPVEALLGVAVSNKDMKDRVSIMCSEANVDIPVKVKPGFYF